MATPLLRALRTAWPDSWLTWIVEETAKEAVDASPYLDEILIWSGREFRARKSILGKVSRFLRFRTLARDIDKRHFDIFITFQAEEWLEVTRLVSAGNKIGFFDYYNEKVVSEKILIAARELFDHVVTKESHPRHKTNQYLSVLPFIGIENPQDLSMNIGFTEKDRAASNCFLAERGISSTIGCIVLAPISNWVTRNWSPDRFAELGDLLSDETGCKIVLIGTKNDQSTLNSIQLRMRSPAVVSAGDLSFREVASLIASAALLVGADSGPMHVAAAVDTPFVAIFGATPIECLAPLKGRGICVSHKVPCGPCYSPHCSNSSTPLICLNKIDVQRVLAACKTLLTER